MFIPNFVNLNLEVKCFFVGIFEKLYFFSLNTRCGRNTWIGLFDNLNTNLVFCFLKIYIYFFHNKFRDQMHEIIQYILHWNPKQFSFFL